MNFLETLHEWVGDDELYRQIISGIDFTDTCWLWLRTQQFGYGYTKIKRTRWRLHRLMYTVKHGPIPPRLEVCHKCDIRNCCNPDHLFLGTTKDNMQDASTKKRWSKQHRTHCIRGHSFAEWSMFKGTKRECRKCHNLLRQERRRVYGRQS